jgi:hypothetical protein
MAHCDPAAVVTTISQPAVHEKDVGTGKSHAAAVHKMGGGNKDGEDGGLGNVVLVPLPPPSANKVRDRMA